MTDIDSLVAVLELTGGSRVVLRSDERPHVMVGDTRHELGSAEVPTTSSLEALAEQILSPQGKHALAEHRAAAEPLLGHDFVVPVRVAVRRIGPQISLELHRNAHSPETNHAASNSAIAAAPIVVAAPPQPAEPPSQVAMVAEAPRARGRKPASPLNIADGRQRPPAAGPLEQLVQRAIERRATAVYLRGGQSPLARVGRVMEPLGAEPLQSSAIEAMAGGASRRSDELRSGSFTITLRDSEDIRQFKAESFRDELGPGLVVHLARSPESVLQTGIPRQVKGICQDDEGIVVVSATAAADVLEMIAAVGTWTARRRAGYLISIEPPDGLGADIVGPFVSARRVSDGGMADAIHRAANETPDVLVVGLHSGVAAEEAVRAARRGSLVILGVVAPTSVRAMESLLAAVPAQRQLHIRRSFAASFRCAFSYRVLHARSGGRRIVHDLVVAAPDMSAPIDRGDFAGIEKLQRTGTDGTLSLDAALVDAVLTGDISVRQAASHALDRQQVVRKIRQSARERRTRKRQV